MSSQEISTRTPAQELVARVRSDEAVEQIKMVLPENVPASRFVRATVTALMQNPEIAKTETDSFFAALIKCATDGLLPDGREAALVSFGNKAQYMPMIGGLRKIAAEHGWGIRTAVVYEADEFSYELGLDLKLVHRPAAPGVVRGRMVAAYAVASHRDGRPRETEVMSADEIEKVRQVSRGKDSGPWRDWPERMWEKTVGRRIFAKLALDPSDRRVASILDASDLPAGEAATMLYGPGAKVFEAREIGGGTEGTGGASTDPDAADEASAAEAASSPDNQQAGGDDAAVSPPPAPGAEPVVQPEPAFKAPAAAVTKAGKQKPPTGANAELTLAEISQTPEGEQWLEWAVGDTVEWHDDFRANLELWTQSKHADIWKRVRA